MLKIKDVIDKLQELNEEEYTIEMEVEPIVNCYEQLNGDGLETIKYRYNIILESKEKSRRYKNKNGIKEYMNRQVK